MKATTLLLAAALSAAGVALSMAQVYSVNMVGHINCQVPAGLSTIANQMDQSPDNQVRNLIRTPPDNTEAYKFYPATGTYQFINYIGGMPPVGWDDGGSGDITMT